MELVNVSDNPKLSKIRKNYDVLDYYRSVFNQWDEDRDGYISIAELKRLICAQENIKLTKEAVDALLINFDVNNDEKLDFEEFLIMINHPSFKITFRKITQKYLKFVIVSRTRTTVGLRRTVTSTGTYEKEVKCKRYTAGMIIISICQVILHHLNYTWWSGKENDPGPIGKALQFDPCKKLDFYRYVSYMFVHNLNDGHAHLYFNVLFQLFLGVPLEMVHSWRLILIYFIGGVGGSMTHSVISIEKKTIGASGGLYSFVAAHIATVLLNWREMSHPIVPLLLFGLIVIFDVSYQSVMKHVFKSVDFSDTSYSSHLGGFITGLLLGVIILRNLKVTKREQVLWHCCLVAFLVFASIMTIVDVYWSLSGKACD